MDVGRQYVVLRHIHYPVIGWRDIPAFPMRSQHTARIFSARETSVRKPRHVACSVACQYCASLFGSVQEARCRNFKLRHYRVFTAFRLRAQRMFTALSTETYPGCPQACSPDLQEKRSGFSTQSSTGLPQSIHRGACSQIINQNRTADDLAGSAIAALIHPLFTPLPDQSCERRSLNRVLSCLALRMRCGKEGNQDEKNHRVCCLHVRPGRFGGPAVG
jgi:hypothetical protein